MVWSPFDSALVSDKHTFHLDIFFVVKLCGNNKELTNRKVRNRILGTVLGIISSGQATVVVVVLGQPQTL